MPLVEIHMLKGKSKEFKTLLLDNIHKALVDSFKIPDYDRNQRIIEFEKDNFEIPSNKSDDFIIVELTIFKGRSTDAKKKLYKSIVDNLENSLGIKGTDVLIILNEPPLENWGIAGGKSACDVDIGFKIDI